MLRLLTAICACLALTGSLQAQTDAINVGAVPAGKVSGEHHTPTFFADDATVPAAMRVMSALVLDTAGR